MKKVNFGSSILPLKSLPQNAIECEGKWSASR